MAAVTFPGGCRLFHGLRPLDCGGAGTARSQRARSEVARDVCSRRRVGKMPGAREHDLETSVVGGGGAQRLHSGGRDGFVGRGRTAAEWLVAAVMPCFARPEQQRHLKYASSVTRR